MANGTFQLPEEVTQARQRAQELTGVAGKYQAGEVSVTDALREKVTRAFSENQDIVGKLDEAIAGYLPSPDVGREKYQDIFNPFQRESLVSQYTANQALPMLTYSNILGQRLGRVEDLIGAGSRAYQAESATRLAEAQQAQQTYQDLLNEYTTLEGLRLRERGGAGGAGGGGGILESLLALGGGLFGGQTNLIEGELYVDDETGEAYIVKNGQLVPFDTIPKEESPGMFITPGGPVFDYDPRGTPGLEYYA